MTKARDLADFLGDNTSLGTINDAYDAGTLGSPSIDDNGNATAITITSDENVGIGTSSPSGKLQVETSGTVANLYVRSDISTSALASRISLGNSTSASRFTLGLLGGGGETAYLGPEGSFPLYFQTNGAERMRIDSSGNVLVGTTDINPYDNTTGSGIALRSSGAIYNAINNGTPLNLNRMGSDGTIAQFRKDGSTVGSIGTDSGVTYYAHSNGDGISISNNYIFPSRYGGARDNQIDIGISWARWDNIYATNGTIQTSDFNEKQDIASLTATEMLVGKRISELFKTFRWKDRVAEKGDNARTHTGVIAQDVQAAFTAEGLDAGDYALFISSTWWEHDVDVPAVEAVAEVLDEDGNVTTEAVEAVDAYTRTDTYNTEDEAPEGATSKTRLGIRYPELLSFVAAYNEQRFASIEARLTALEA